MLGTKRIDDFEPYWQDEKDWLCIVEFLPTDNPEARLFAADIIGYLVRALTSFYFPFRLLRRKTSS